ncbi:MAG: GatB/YqeY domain-containing protein [Caldilineae bacterium]|nr:GatB/YqeY domain-containing protein [Anaerolineae bacterium]MCB9143618.1 GatB/YqeY domain-containing protein [Anaerolineales bacterium]MCB9153257.1 GatB/YqeY domain-containing protein [Caldilineae bacterium]MCB0200437.1 GatB/YqeY domain-containing protein [Anaerolineae bacterium]MCB0205311.1 GatB/YqeY domain-containing protein [Anaerolineae bacterium]
MSLQQQIDTDLKAAMLARDEPRKLALRSVKTAIQNAIVEKRSSAGADASLTDDEVLQLIKQQAKQRRESISEFSAGGRDDLIPNEETQLAVLEEYLPQQLSREEITVVVQAVIVETGAQSPRDLGIVMRGSMAQLQNRADGKLVNEVARELLANTA